MRHTYLNFPRKTKKIQVIIGCRVSIIGIHTSQSRARIQLGAGLRRLNDVSLDRIAGEEKNGERD